MIKSVATTVISGLLVLAISFSCKHELPEPPVNNGSNNGSSNEPCDPNVVYFTLQVLPVLVSNCSLSGCHDEASHEEGVVLTSYNKVMATGEVKRGNPGESKLYRVIADTDHDDRMPPPPQNPLTQEQKELIFKWIQQGSQNLFCKNSCEASVTSFSGAISPLINTKCVGCHSGGSPQGGIDLTTYVSIKAQVENGKLWGSVSHQPGFSPMPRNGVKLSDCELTQIKNWIDAGALNN